MTVERSVVIEGKTYTVTISDEREALLAAQAAGRAIVELWRKDRKAEGFSPAPYAIENMEDADESFLERIVRRSLGFPWIMVETERLVIREFCLADAKSVPKEEVSGSPEGQADRIFYTPKLLSSYIQCQYRFYEYGVWAVTEKESGALIGKAGVWDREEEGLELGYHIFAPYRRQGYGREAVLGILDYVKEYLDASSVEAKTDASNEASVHLLESLDFQLIGKKRSGSGQELRLYAQNLLPHTDTQVPQ